MEAVTTSNIIRPVSYQARLRGLHKQLADAQWEGDDKLATEIIKQINLVDAMIANGERYEVNF
jgi:hypothetical protein